MIAVNPNGANHGVALLSFVYPRAGWRRFDLAYKPVAGYLNPAGLPRTVTCPGSNHRL